MPLKATILAGLVAGAAITLLPGDPASGQLGASSAQARQVYTRKRVNGRWITGVFPKDGRSARGHARHRLATRGRGRYSPREVARDEDDEAPPIPPARPVLAVTETSSIAPSGDRKIESMRSALEAHARLLAERAAQSAAGSQPAPTAPSVPAQPVASAPQSPKSVTFDFERGLKTVVFADGAAQSEPFDTAGMREIAAVRNVNR